MRIRSVFGVLVLCLSAGAPVGHAQVAKPNVSQVAKPTVQSAEPCCAVTSIDGETGIVTARVTATRRALAFKVTDATLLQSLRIGQKISADFRTRRVTVTGLTPCCEISSFDPENGAVPPAVNASPATAASAPAGLGTHAYEVDGVEVNLLSVQRTSGDSLTVRWQYRNTTSQPRSIGASFGGMGWSEVFSLVYDAYLLDGQTKYPVQKDASGNLISAKQGSGKTVTIAAKGTHSVWARFPAPPATITKISIFIPGTEPFEDIAIGTAGSQAPARRR